MDNRKSSLAFGPRTKKHILQGKNIRKQEDGRDNFEDYWTDSDDDSSVYSKRSVASSTVPQKALSVESLNLNEDEQDATLNIGVHNENQSPSEPMSGEDFHFNGTKNLCKDSSRNSPVKDKISSQPSDITDKVIQKDPKEHINDQHTTKTCNKAAMPKILKRTFRRSVYSPSKTFVKESMPETPKHTLRSFNHSPAKTLGKESMPETPKHTLRSFNSPAKTLDKECMPETPKRTLRSFNHSPAKTFDKNKETPQKSSDTLSQTILKNTEKPIIPKRILRSTCDSVQHDIVMLSKTNILDFETPDTPNVDEPVDVIAAVLSKTFNKIEKLPSPSTKKLRSAITDKMATADTVNMLEENVVPLSKTHKKSSLLPRRISEICSKTRKKSVVVTKSQKTIEMEEINAHYDEYDAKIMQMIYRNDHDESAPTSPILEIKKSTQKPLRHTRSKQIFKSNKNFDKEKPSEADECKGVESPSNSIKSESSHEALESQPENRYSKKKSKSVVVAGNIDSIVQSSSKSVNDNRVSLMSIENFNTSTDNHEKTKNALDNSKKFKNIDKKDEKLDETKSTNYGETNRMPLDKDDLATKNITSNNSKEKEPEENNESCPASSHVNTSSEHLTASEADEQNTSANKIQQKRKSVRSKRTSTPQKKTKLSHRSSNIRSALHNSTKFKNTDKKVKKLAETKSNNYDEVNLMPLDKDDLAVKSTMNNSSEEKEPGENNEMSLPPSHVNTSSNHFAVAENGENSISVEKVKQKRKSVRSKRISTPQDKRRLSLRSSSIRKSIYHKLPLKKLKQSPKEVGKKSKHLTKKFKSTSKKHETRAIESGENRDDCLVDDLSLGKLISKSYCSVGDINDISQPLNPAEELAPPSMSEAKMFVSNKNQRKSGKSKNMHDNANQIHKSSLNEKEKDNIYEKTDGIVKKDSKSKNISKKYKVRPVESDNADDCEDNQIISSNVISKENVASNYDVEKENNHETSQELFNTSAHSNHSAANIHLADNHSLPETSMKQQKISNRNKSVEKDNDNEERISKNPDALEKSSLGEESTHSAPGNLPPPRVSKKQKKNSNKRKKATQDENDVAEECLLQKGDTRRQFSSSDKENDLALQSNKRKKKSLRSKTVADEPRRSSRQRFAPLARWRNERALFRFEHGDIKFLGIDEGTKEDDGALQALSKRMYKPNNSKQLYRPKKAQLNDPIMKKKVTINLQKKFSLVPWAVPLSAVSDKTSQHSYLIKKLFETSTHAFGYLQIEKGHEKPQQFMPEDDVLLTLIRGAVEINIQKNMYTLSEKDMFLVPRSSVYNVKNVGERKALLQFTIGRFKYLESA